LAFTFSCSSDSSDDPTPVQSSSSDGGSSSSSAEEPASSSSAVPQHVLTINIEPTADGTVLRNPAKDAYDHGTVVTVTAEPEFGHEFTGWVGAATGTNNPIEITMDGNKELTANFAQLMSGSFTDPRDSKTYEWVRIGGEVWMAQNLNYNAAGSKCYDNSESNCETYGRLYNWATAMDVCLPDWHLPSEAEWDALTTAVGGTGTGGRTGAGAKLKATSGWSSGNGTDDFGFSALPGGHGYSNGSFDLVGDNGYWWTSSERNSDYAYNRFMYGSGSNVYFGSNGKGGLHSVRCVLD